MHEELVQVLVLEGTQQTHQTGFGPLALEQAEELVEEAVVVEHHQQQDNSLGILH